MEEKDSKKVKFIENKQDNIDNEIDNEYPRVKFDDSDGDENIDFKQPRRPRQVTVYYQRYSNDHYKILIPYDFEEKRYYAKPEDIDFYDHKDYLLAKLNEFCQNPVFDIEKKIIPKGIWQKFIIHLPKFLFFFISIYIFIFIALLTFFNPAILTILYFIIRKVYQSLKIIRFVKYEKLKMKEIVNILEKENNSKMCIDNKIKWVLGQSGYWLEIVRKEEKQDDKSQRDSKDSNEINKKQ